MNFSVADMVYLLSKHLSAMCSSANTIQARMTKVILDRLRCETFLAHTMPEAVEQMQMVQFDIIVMDGYSFRLVCLISEGNSTNTTISLNL